MLTASRLPHLRAALKYGHRRLQFPHLHSFEVCSDLRKIESDVKTNGLQLDALIHLPVTVTAVLSDVPALMALLHQSGSTASRAAPGAGSGTPSAAAATQSSTFLGTARPSVQVPLSEVATTPMPSSTSGVQLPLASSASAAEHNTAGAGAPPAAAAAAAAVVAGPVLHAPVPLPPAVTTVPSTAAASPHASAADLALLASNEVISEPGAPTAALSATIEAMLGASMTGTPKRLQRIVSQCAGHKVGYIFAEPVTEAIAPGYGKIVHHPMDLSTMRDRITGGDIGSWTGLADALCLMCRNALVYNPPTSDVHTATLGFFDHALRLVQDGSGGKDFGRSDEAATTRDALIQQVLQEASAVKGSLGLVDAGRRAAASAEGGAGDDDAGSDGGRRGGVKRRGSVAAAAKQGPGEGPRSAKRPRR